jgi:hypothetical protein
MALLRPGARDTEYHTEDARSAVAPTGKGRHCASNVLPTGATQSGISPHGVGTVSMPDA